MLAFQVCILSLLMANRADRVHLHVIFVGIIYILPFLHLLKVPWVSCAKSVGKNVSGIWKRSKWRITIVASAQSNDLQITICRELFATVLKVMNNLHGLFLQFDLQVKLVWLEKVREMDYGSKTASFMHVLLTMQWYKSGLRGFIQNQ